MASNSDGKINSDDKNITKRTFSIVMNTKHNPILNELTHISKNVYNITIFINNIFLRYKDEIYKKLIESIEANLKKRKKSKINPDEIIQNNLQYFYDLNTNENSKINTNCAIIKEIIEKVTSEYFLNNDNYDIIKEKVIKKAKKKIEYDNIYECEYIIDNFLKSMLSGIKYLDTA